MQFTKLQGAGNDYIFVDGSSQLRDWSELSRRVSDRHFGVGSDGLIVVVPSQDADVRMLMYNADGSRGEMCGNGIRCFAKFVLERKLVPSPNVALSVETGAGLIAVRPWWEGGRSTGARVDMGAPVLRAGDVPVDRTALGPSDYAKLDAGIVERFTNMLRRWQQRHGRVHEHHGSFDAHVGQVHADFAGGARTEADVGSRHLERRVLLHGSNLCPPSPE